MGCLGFSGSRLLGEVVEGRVGCGWCGVEWKGKVED